MLMQKKTLFIIGLLITLAFVILGYLQLQKLPQEKTLNLLPLPENSIELLVRINDDLIENSNSIENTIGKKIVEIKELSDLVFFWKKRHNTIKQNLRDPYVHIQSDRHQLSWIMLANLKSDNSPSSFTDLSQNLNIVDTLFYDYGSIFKSVDDKRTLYLSLIDNYFLASPFRIDIEKHIRLLKTNSVPKKEPSENLVKLWKTADHSAALNILFNYDKYPAFADVLFQKDQSPMNINELKWGVFDINIQNDKLFVSGLNLNGTQTSDKTPVRFKSHEWLPSSVISFKQYALTTKEQFIDDSFPEKHSEQAKDFWLPILQEEYTNALIFNPLKSNRKSQIALIPISSAEALREQLYYFFSERKLVEQKLNLAVEGKNLSIFKIPLSLSSGFIESTNELHLAIAENMAIIGETSAIKTTLRNWYRGRSLKKKTKYQQHESNWTNASTFRFYLNPERGQFWTSDFFLPEYQNRIKKSKSIWADFSGFSLQNEYRGKFIYTGMLLEFSPQENQEAKAAWACKLDAPVAQKPTFVKNHYSGNNEILVQDMENTLYQINEKGEILWKRKINEKIKSRVYQIDFYQNGKLQMVFNTTNKIYGLDRLGRDLEGYPINLPFPATNPLAVFDYENNGKYRYIIACLNKRVYAFTKTGKQVDGWARPVANSEVKQEIRHFLVGNKDYIVFSDKERLYVLNRRGDERVRLKQQFTASENNLLYLEMNPAENRPYIVTTSSSGDIFKVFLDGSVRKQSIKPFTENHFFTYRDFDADGLPDYIFVDNKQVSVYNQLFEPLFSYKFKNQIFTQPSYFNFSLKNKGLGLFSKNEEQYYIFNNDGTMAKGFPLSAQSPMTIGRFSLTNNSFDALVSSNNNYLFNYHLFGK